MADECEGTKGTIKWAEIIGIQTKNDPRPRRKIPGRLPFQYTYDFPMYSHTYSRGQPKPACFISPEQVVEFSLF